jgi:hypothetical protein
MIGMVAGQRSSGGGKAIRIPILVNFLLLVALVGPLKSSRLYGTLKSLSLDDALTWIIQGWFIGSTIITSALYARSLKRKLRCGTETSTTDIGLVIDGAMLFAWWVTLLVIIAWALMLGMGTF